MKKNFWLNLFLVLVGVVLGSMIAHYTAGVKGLSWLAFGMDFGTTSPLVLELGIIALTIGGKIKLSVATIICTALSFIIGKFIVKR